MRERVLALELWIGLVGWIDEVRGSGLIDFNFSFSRFEKNRDMAEDVDMG